MRALTGSQLVLVAPSRPAVAARMLAGAQLVPVQVAPSRPVVGAALLRQVAEEQLVPVAPSLPAVARGPAEEQ